MKNELLIYISITNIISIIIPLLPVIKKRRGNDNFLDSILTCGICLNFILGSTFLSAFAEPMKTITGLDSFFNLFFDGLISTISLVIIGFTGELLKKVFNFIHELVLKIKNI